MSRAFVRDIEDQTGELPDKPISPHRNLVTESGLAAMDATLGHFEAMRRTAIETGDSQAAAGALREVRYWRTRRATAEVVKAPAENTRVAFGTIVILRRDDGREQSYQIVGEDEADPARGTISYVSPLARALMTHVVGDRVEIAGREAIILDIR